jgi:hypothetical protein
VIAVGTDGGIRDGVHQIRGKKRGYGKAARNLLLSTDARNQAAIRS